MRRVQVWPGSEPVGYAAMCRPVCGRARSKDSAVSAQWHEGVVLEGLSCWLSEPDRRLAGGVTRRVCAVPVVS